MCMMHSHNHDAHDSGGIKGWLFSPTGLVTACVLVILGFLVYEGHGAHLLGFTPYLLILACPLMHIFMHHGRHGGHLHSDHEGGNIQNAKENKKHDGGCH